MSDAVADIQRRRSGEKGGGSIVADNFILPISA